jgi:flagellar biosynthesis/type III secretory pathway protein FliH
MNFNEEERDFYEDHLKWLRIETNSLKKAKEDGRVEGRVEGIEKGIEIGEARGRVEGEIKKEKEFVIKLYLAGQPLEFIAQVANLSTLQIQEIIGELV